MSNFFTIKTFLTSKLLDDDYRTSRISTVLLYTFYIGKVFLEGTSKSSTDFFTVYNYMLVLATTVPGVPETQHCFGAFGPKFFYLSS